MDKQLKILKDYFTLVLPFLWKDRRCFLSTVATFLLTVIGSFAIPISPWLFSEVIRCYQEENMIYLWFVTVLLAICWLLTKTVKRLRSIVFFHVVNEAIRTIRLRLITHFHHITLRGGPKYDTSEVLSASTRVSLSIRFCLRSAFLSFIPTLFTLITSAVAMQYVFPGSKYFLIAIWLTYGYVFIALDKFIRIRHTMWETSDEVMVAMGDSLKQRGFAKLHPEVEEKRLRKLFDKELQGWWKENIANNSIHLVQNLLFFLITSAFLGYLVWLLSAGEIDVPKFVMLKGYIFVIHRQIFNLTEYIRGTSAYIVDMKKVLDILSLTTEEALGREGREVQLTEEGVVIKLDKISFSYADTAPNIIQDLSLDIHPGDKVAIIGASGSGKSTLAQLMAGIYLPQNGKVLFRGSATEDLTPAAMGRSLYFVGQDDPLIAGSIRDNLMVEGQAELSPLSYLKDIIDHAEKGRQLSGGERQRVLLARCLSYKPELVLLDEALSYLDEKSGRALLDLVLEKVPTVILMTHRKELLDKMDHVYKLIDGRLQKQ